MKHQALFVVSLVLLTAERLPAPIRELPESPTPEPEQSTTPTAEPAQASTKKRASSSAASSASEVTAELKALVNKLLEAVSSTHDMSVLQSILADDFVAVDATGVMRKKAAYIDFIRNIRFESVRVENLEVRITGATTATVVGTERETEIVRNGEKLNLAFRFGAKWAKRGGRWQCVGARFVSM